MMENELNLAFVCEFVRLSEEAETDLGKIKLQKLIYFLQASGVKLGYRYRIFHFGPYSRELASDVDRLETLNVINVEPDNAGYGYHITAGKHLKTILGEFAKEENPHHCKLKSVFEYFSNDDSAQIELSATAHFVLIAQERKGLSTSKEDVVRIVEKLKPRFAKKSIENSFEKMEEYIKSSQ